MFKKAVEVVGVLINFQKRRHIVGFFKIKGKLKKRELILNTEA